MNYREARDYLDSLSKFGSILGTERMIRLMRELGDPQDYLRFVHVAGTNGKGSVTAMTSTILEESGYKVGRYISPYLEDFRERASVNSVNIPEERVAALLTRIKSVAQRMAADGEQPTEFEVVTAMGFLHFFEEQCDVVCLEVGLGGRCDATNAIKASEVAAITSIGMDHMDRLGNTLEEIAVEKAGIIRQRSIVVSAPQKPGSLRVIERTCREREAPLCMVGRDITWEVKSSGTDGQVLDFSGLNGNYPEVHLSLLGDHQQENAAVTLGIVECLHASSNFEVPARAIYEGFRRVSWPGRLEILAKQPFVVVDAAHNADGARSLAKSVRSFLPHRNLILVLGILGDKDASEIIEALGSMASAAIITKPLSNRAVDSRDLAGRLQRFVPDVTVEDDIHKAIDSALNRASSRDLVLIAGSIYLAGPARTYLRSKSLELFRPSGIYV